MIDCCLTSSEQNISNIHDKNHDKFEVNRTYCFITNVIPVRLKLEK